MVLFLAHPVLGNDVASGYSFIYIADCRKFDYRHATALASSFETHVYQNEEKQFGIIIR